MTASLPLFRTEALRHRSDRLHGNVSMATPIAWQVISLLLFVALAITVAFLATASYARVEMAAGTVTLDTGVSAVMPSRSGIVAAIMVREGQRVRAGDPLVRIRSEEDMIGGDTAPARIRSALGEQDALLASQGGALLAASDAEQDRLREQVAGLNAELESLARQIDEQHRLVDAALADFASVREVAANGFISRRDLDSRQATVFSRRQQLAQLEQLRAAHTADIAQARRSMAQSHASARAQMAGAQSGRAALAQQLAQANLARGYVITAPVAGVVTAMTARVGQAASAQQQLMVLLPAGSAPQIELYVPSAAAGFLRPGQEVRVAVDAFPYQTFGTVAARVIDVSGAAIARPGPDGPSPVYLVTAALPAPWIKAFGRRQPLIPGMTLNARIVTEQRSLLEWLFQPIFAVRNR